MLVLVSLADLAHLLPKLSAPKDMDTDSNSSGGVSAAMEGLSTADMVAAAVNIAASASTAEEEGIEYAAAGETAGTSAAAGTSNTIATKKANSSQWANHLKQVRPLINVTSRLVLRARHVSFTRDKFTKL